MSLHLITYCNPEYWRVTSVTQVDSKELTDKVESLESKGFRINFICDTSQPISLFNLGVSMREYSTDEQDKIRGILCQK